MIGNNFKVNKLRQCKWTRRQRIRDRLGQLGRWSALALLLLAPAAAWGDDASDSSPNVVIVLIDDLRHDTFGFAGHPFLETPHLDDLASGGVRFTNAFVTTSLCSPSRASFLTGQYMHHHGVIDNQRRMSEQTRTFPQLLRQHGYRTAFVGKWHMGGSSDEPRPGFDHWVSFKGQGTYAPDGQTLNVNGRQVPRTKYMTDELTDHSVRWIGEQRPDQPFLLYLSHKGVHGLYDPAERHRDRYRDAPLEMPSTMSDTPENRRGKPRWVQNQRNSWHGVEYPYHGRSGQTVAQMYRHYCEMILSIDESLGRVREALRRHGLAENTVVIFTSDGGHLWGEHGLIDKRCAYEPSIRIPMLVAAPALVPRSARVEEIVANIDVAPTVLELAGIEPPETMDGRSFLDLLQVPDRTDRPPRQLLYEYYWEHGFPQTPTTFALRDDRYKLIQYHGIWDTDEFYDLQDDPDERRNLIDDPVHRERIRAMRQALHKRLADDDATCVPFGLKRGAGAHLRSRDGARAADFPESTYQP